MANYGRLRAPIQDQQDWRSRGTCRDLDTAVFFHPDLERGQSRDARTAAAQAVCARCPVLERCREHALTVREPYGTWGGLDELERQHLITTRGAGGRAPA